MISKMISKKNKKKYSVPTLEVVEVETPTILDGSLGKGQTDGQGNHTLPADAKQSLWIWDDDEEWYDEDDWSYSYQIE